LIARLWHFTRANLNVMNVAPAYYLSISGKEYGPYTVADLEAALADDTISPDCMVRPGIGGDWNPVIEVVGGTVEKPTVRIRRKTAYRSLRALVGTACFLLLVTVASLCGYHTYLAGNSREIAHIVVAAQFFGWTLAVVVLWGLSRVVIDMADKQIATEARPAEPSEE
jgi:hypothetical protein